MDFEQLKQEAASLFPLASKFAIEHPGEPNTSLESLKRPGGLLRRSRTTGSGLIVAGRLVRCRTGCLRVEGARHDAPVLPRCELCTFRDPARRPDSRLHGNRLPVGIHPNGNLRGVYARGVPGGLRPEGSSSTATHPVLSRQPHLDCGHFVVKSATQARLGRHLPTPQDNLAIHALRCYNCIHDRTSGIVAGKRTTREISRRGPRWAAPGGENHSRKSLW